LEYSCFSSGGIVGISGGVPGGETGGIISGGMVHVSVVGHGPQSAS